MKYTTVSIPKPLNDKIKKLIKGTGFSSASSFVIFVMRDLLTEKKGRSLIIEEGKIKKRLKTLGYL